MGKVVWQQAEINELVKNIKLHVVEKSAQVMQSFLDFTEMLFNEIPHSSDCFFRAISEHRQLLSLHRWRCLKYQTLPCAEAKCFCKVKAYLWIQRLPHICIEIFQSSGSSQDMDLWGHAGQTTNPSSLVKSCTRPKCRYNPFNHTFTLFRYTQSQTLYQEANIILTMRMHELSPPDCQRLWGGERKCKNTAPDSG